MPTVFIVFILLANEVSAATHTESCLHETNSHQTKLDFSSFINLNLY